MKCLVCGCISESIMSKLDICSISCKKAYRNSVAKKWYKDNIEKAKKAGLKSYYKRLESGKINPDYKYTSYRRYIVNLLGAIEKAYQLGLQDGKN